MEVEKEEALRLLFFNGTPSNLVAVAVGGFAAREGLTSLDFGTSVASADRAFATLAPSLAHASASGGAYWRFLLVAAPERDLQQQQQQLGASGEATAGDVLGTGQLSAPDLTTGLTDDSYGLPLPRPGQDRVGAVPCFLVEYRLARPP